MSPPDAGQHQAEQIIAGLVALGVRLACVCPGSRSTPLTVAAARHPDLRCVLRLDERGAGFHALGWGRATGAPAAVICTSGTAVANLLPAVVEASMDHVPLLILSADRPPELRGRGANQTIPQAGIFGGFPRWTKTLPPAGPDLPWAAVADALAAAVRHATRGNPGPVHLNLQLRKPLHGAPQAAPAPPRIPRVSVAPTAGLPDPARIRALLDDPTGVLLVGRLPWRHRDAVARLSRALGWPTFADITSGLRLGSGDLPTVGMIDTLLRTPRWADALRPQVVLQIGPSPLSVRLARHLQDHPPADQLQVQDHPDTQDPHGTVTWRIEGDVPALCGALADLAPPKPAPRTRWRAASDALERAAESWLSDTPGLGEIAAVRALTADLLPNGALFLSASMPVRHADRFAARNGSAVPVAANRGASGIDGVLSTAIGWGAGHGRPVTLIIGDLALLHDLNALRAAGGPMAIVVLNNDGGAIFSQLPVVAQRDVFEPWFGTPHGLGFRAAAEMFGLRYANPRTPFALIAAHRAALRAPSPTLIEVATRRDDTAAISHALDHHLGTLADTLPPPT